MSGFTTRPVIQGTRGVVAAGHHLAAAAGFRALERGGNAVDAAATMTFCLALVEPHNCGLGGEVPVLLWSAKEKRARAISGQGSAPAEMTLEWFRRAGIDLIPGDGLLGAMVPAVVGTWSEALTRFGSFTFAQVLEPAIELAEEGFPMYPSLHTALAQNAERIVRDYPDTANVWLREGQPPAVGELVGNPAWARVLRRMCDAEAKAASRGRTAGIEAAREEFYKGETAARICDWLAKAQVRDASGRANKGFLTRIDLMNWRAAVEEPARGTYRGIEVCKCPPWSQGPVFLQQLALLEGFDLNGMGHNSAEHLHTYLECAKLAFADREAYYGDPVFDQVPLDALLAKGYADARRTLVGPESSREFRPGTPNGSKLPAVTQWFDPGADARESMVHAHDTTHCDAIDRWGNMVAATPSGGWIQSSPVIPGVGFPLGTRGQMFYLNPRRANALKPGKRPRTTLTPSLALKDGKPWMVFGTQGGDQQDQWTLQFFLNLVDFGMDLQEALDAPTAHTTHFPSSFHPRAAEPNTVYVEGRIPAEIRDALAAKGHEVKVNPDWHHGRVMAARLTANGVMEAAASPRDRMAYAIGW